MSAQSLSPLRARTTKVEPFAGDTRLEASEALFGGRAPAQHREFCATLGLTLHDCRCSAFLVPKLDGQLKITLAKLERMSRLHKNDNTCMQKGGMPPESHAANQALTYSCWIVSEKKNESKRLTAIYRVNYRWICHQPFTRHHEAFGVFDISHIRRNSHGSRSSPAHYW